LAILSANTLILNINGVITHPGSAFGKMQNAIKIASEIIEKLPKDSLSPETTKGKEGFIHPISVSAIAESAEIKFILRDFETSKLKEYEDIIINITNEVLKHYNKSSYSYKIVESYRNMKEVLNKYPFITDYAIKAIERAGIKPLIKSVRGGTDGSKLSFMGLPCPNLFTGAHGIHSKQEWISVQDMQKAVETVVHLCMIWEEKS
jgi:tripeptide aminopeptidase